MGLEVQRSYSLLEHPLPSQSGSSPRARTCGRPSMRCRTTLPPQDDMYPGEMSDEEEEVTGPTPWRSLRPQSTLQQADSAAKYQQTSYSDASPYIHVPPQIHPIAFHSGTPRYEDLIHSVRSRISSASKKPSLYSSLHGDPISRYGRAGAPWRHVRRTLGYQGNNVLFVDGTVKQDDSVVNPPWTWDALHSTDNNDFRLKAYLPAASQAGGPRRPPGYLDMWQQHARNHQRAQRYSPRSRLMSDR